MNIEVTEKPHTESLKGQCRHRVNGKLYDVVCIGNILATRPGWPVTVVYRDAEGAIWALCINEFLGKFEMIKEAAEFEALLENEIKVKERYVTQFKVCGNCMTAIEGERIEYDEYMPKRTVFLHGHPFLMLADHFDLGKLDEACQCCTAPPGFRYLVEQL